MEVSSRAQGQKMLNVKKIGDFSCLVSRNEYLNRSNDSILTVLKIFPVVSRKTIILSESRKKTNEQPFTFLNSTRKTRQNIFIFLEREWTPEYIYTKICHFIAICRQHSHSKNGCNRKKHGLWKVWWRESLC